MRPIDGVEIIEELGRGGMGVVYRARHPRLGEVAIKVMLSLDPEDLLRFQREAKATARISHPHVVPLHQAGVSEGRPYLLMHLVEGESLSQQLRRDGPLLEQQAARLAAQLASALDCAHREGVLHRDLKPANVFLDQQGDALLGDFGLALLQDSGRLTATGTVLGSPNYMAPEQALGSRQRLGPHTDVYGLGATLYAMLTGRPPFQGKGLAETLSAVVNDPLVPPRALRPGLNKELEGICLRCLEKAPAARYASAGAVEQALKGFLRHARPGRRRVRPRRRWLGAAVGLILLGSLAASGIVWRGVDPTPASTTPTPRGSNADAVPAPSLGESVLQRLVLQPGPLLGCDTFVKGFNLYLNDNYGCDSSLQVGARALTRPPRAGFLRAYLRFELDRLPAGAEVESAVLQLTSGSSAQVEFELLAWYVDPRRGEWVEGSSTHDYYLDGLCWQGDIAGQEGDWSVDSDLPRFDQPGMSEGEGPLASVHLPPGESGIATLDVTEAVRAWSGGEIENHGLCLTGREDGGNTSQRRIFYSSDWSVLEERPRLMISYRGAPPLPSTVTADEARARVDAEALLTPLRDRLAGRGQLSDEDLARAGEAIRVAPHWWRVYMVRSQLLERIDDPKLYGVPNALRDLRGALLRAPGNISQSTLRPRIVKALHEVNRRHGKQKLKEQLYYVKGLVDWPELDELLLLVNSGQ